MTWDAGEESGDLSEVDALSDLLKQLPAGHTIVWGDAHMRLTDTVWRASWIDVQVPELNDSLKWNWTWTIVTPGDGDSPAPGEDSCVIPVEPDCTVFTYLDPETQWFSTSGPVWVGRPGETPPSEVAHEIAAGGEPLEVPGWSLAAVNQALAKWCHEHTGRSDFTFAFNDNIAMGQPGEATQALDKVADTLSKETYQIDEGVFATEQFMDTLLAMPQDEAAAVMRQIKHVRGGFHDGHGIDFPR